MTPVKSSRRLLSLALSLWLGGCALIHHDTPPHAQITADSIRLADDLHLASAGWPDAQWWTRYHDDQLDALITQAIATSPTMQMARLRVLQAQAQADAVGAAGGPQVGAVGAAVRGRGPLSDALVSSSPWYSAGAVGLFGMWDLDLWGKHRAAIRAALGARQAGMAEAANVELGLACGIAQAYFSLLAGYQRLALLEQSQAALSFAVQAHQGKAAGGMEAKTSLHSARGQLLAVQREMASTQSQLLRDREGIRALVGAGAGDLPELRQVSLPDIGNSGVPASLSYELLARRADLQAMRWYVQASFDQVEVARAAFYPSLDLLGYYGQVAAPLDNLFKHASQQGGLIPVLSLPIFDGGLLNARLRGARASSDLMIEQYNQAVLDAVRDVATAGSQLRFLAQERGLQVEKLEAARFAQGAADAKYAQGLGSRLSVEEAKLPVIDEQVALVVLDTQRLNQQLTLIKALGGGYHVDTLSKDAVGVPAAASEPSADGLQDASRRAR